MHFTMCLLAACIAVTLTGVNAKVVSAPYEDAGGVIEEIACKQKRNDIYFLLDSSRSVDPQDFRLMLDFVRDTVASFHISPRKTRVGVLTTGNVPDLQMNLDTFRHKERVLGQIDRIRYTGGVNDIGAGIHYMRDLMAAWARRHSARIAVIITAKDGPASKAVVESMLARASGIHIIVVGVGPNVKKTELHAMTRPNKENVFYVPRVGDLPKKKQDVFDNICRVEAVAGKKGLEDQVETPAKGCGGKPADIVFVVDSSSSIWGPDFDKQLNFIEAIISSFEIAENLTKVGIVTFSDKSHVEFDLNKYKEEKNMKTAVNSIKQILGGTNTASAITEMSDLFKGGRPNDVPQIAIIMTDGKSRSPEETVKAANKVRKSATHVFVIGVGDNIDQKELNAIASSPKDRYVFEVDDYDALDTIRELLGIEVCKATLPPTPPTTTPTTTLPTTTTEAPVPADEACGSRIPADVMFAIPGAMNPDDTNKALNFVKNIIDEFDVGENGVQVGLVPKDCDPVAGFALNEFKSKGPLIKAIEASMIGGSKTAQMLKNMRLNGFNAMNGGRENVKRFGIVVVDDDECNLTEVAKEAAKARSVHNIELFVIGVGKDVDQDALRAIASGPSDQHIFTVGNYNEIENIAKGLKKNICATL